MRERQRLEKALSRFRALERELADNIELIALGEAERDHGVVGEAEAALGTLRDRAAQLEIEALLSGEADANDCFLEIHAGAGGTESQDWAEMLARMYVRWAERHDYKVEWLEETAGEQAGLKSVTLKIGGENAYGWLKTESGVHRLVRISPFDANARRQTSFASVWVYPVIDETIAIEILDKDLRVDTYRSSGAGGQHVNKTDSAVRITHLPTGIVVACQTDRSQHRNRANAMNMLKARLYEAELQKREAAAQAVEAAKTDIGWGHQIRSYVLQPYQMVKDLRTDVQTSNTQAVLDGDLDEFMAAALAQRIGGAQAQPAQSA
jgi:peptide chain release factor 2